MWCPDQQEDVRATAGPITGRPSVRAAGLSGPRPVVRDRSGRPPAVPDKAARTDTGDEDDMGQAEPAGLAEVIRELATPLAAGAGVDLEDVVVKGSRGSRVVRVVVDADAGVDVATCARLSRALEELMDTRELFEASYTLQVTSPGADRPLRSGRDFRRNAGRPVRIAHAARGRDHPPTGEIQGVVVTADDTTVTLEVDGEQVQVPLTEVAHGKVVLPW